MSVIMLDGIKDIMFHNGIVRVECLSAGPGGEQRPSGTLIMPGVVLKALANAMQEFDKKMREHAAEQAAKAAQAAPAFNFSRE